MKTETSPSREGGVETEQGTDLKNRLVECVVCRSEGSPAEFATVFFSSDSKPPIYACEEHLQEAVDQEMGKANG